jgi:phosphoglycolate phosphatase-like HAD superfamily hydrolase
VDAERETARDIGYSVFKTEEEYAARGFMEGAEELLAALNDHGFEMHVITAGDPEVQLRKVRGLGLDRYFDESHVVPIDSKAEHLRTLMNTHGYTPDETFLVGNSLTSDIKAALDADARGVYIPTHEWRPTENREYYENHERVHIYESLSTLNEDCPEAFLRGVPAESA